MERGNSKFIIYNFEKWKSVNYPHFYTDNRQNQLMTMLRHCDLTSQPYILLFDPPISDWGTEEMTKNMLLSCRKIDNNYDKRLPFFQEWKIKEVKVKSI